MIAEPGGVTSPGVRSDHRRSVWLDLLRSAYDIPAAVSDRNVEAVAAAKLAAQQLPANAAPSGQQIPPPTAVPDAEAAVHHAAIVLVQTARRLGDAGLLDGLFVALGSPSPDEGRLADGIIALAGFPASGGSRAIEARAMAVQLLADLHKAGSPLTAS